MHDVHTYTVAFSPSVLIKCSVCLNHPLMRTLRMNGSRKRSTAYDTESYSFVNPAAVQKIGDLEKDMKSTRVVKPKFTTDFPGAVVREGADELTLKRERCALPSTPRMWETNDGGHRSLTRPGTPSDRLFTGESRDQNGSPCTTSL